MTRHALSRRRLGLAGLGSLITVSVLAVSGTALASGAHRSPAPQLRHQALSSSLRAQDESTDYTPPGPDTVVVADCGGGAVRAIATDGTVTTLASGYECPAGVAVDADGNVYFATYSSDQTAYEIHTDGTVTPIGSGLSFALGVDVDDDGDVFVADSDNARVVEITPDGTQTTVPFTGLARPYGVSVDSEGDVFTTEPDLGTVIELTPDGTQTVIGSGFGYPSGVSATADGSVLVSDDENNRIVQIATDGTQTTLPIDGLSAPADVAVDPAGNVYTVNYGGSGVFELSSGGTQTTVSADVGGYGIAVMNDTRTPQAVTFASDAPTDAVPGDTYSVAATGGDSENQVTFKAATASARICVVTDNGDGTADVDLNRAGVCEIDAAQAGDETYRPARAHQNVTVVHRQAITFTSTPQRPAVDGTYQVTATGGDSENAVVFALGGKSEDGCTVTSDGLVTFQHATSCVVEADQTGSDGYAPAPSAYQEISINRGTQKVTFTTVSPTKAKVGRTYAPAATGGSTGHRIRISATGACTARRGVVTFTHAGHCYVYASQPGNADYLPGKSHQTITVVKP
jgi:sugar lactone lactonase YvrE